MFTRRIVTRRSFFDQVGTGLLGGALATLLGRDLYGGSELIGAESGGSPQGGKVYDLLPRKHHHQPRATSVIHLFMNGGPSQMDLFDPKPALDKHDGKSHFEKIAGEVESPHQAGALMRSAFKFARRGQCGMWVSDALPHLAGCVDDITLIRSMHTTSLTHEPALWKIHSGRILPGLPSLGAWVTYGLGSENQNLPAYVVLDDPLGLPVNRTQNWQAGFLPPLYQGTRFSSIGSPILNLDRQFDEPDEVTQLELQLVSSLDRIHRDGGRASLRLGARIASYELAARMQLAASDALDLSQESVQTLEMYGIGHEPTDSYGRRCLYARRLVERGVRFVQLFLNHQIWDNHSYLVRDLKAACHRTDQPVAALLRDLKQRGLFEKTLVVWGGEMGRLPISQLMVSRDTAIAGRDHNKNAMVTWMAGGGTRAGLTYGATDELGFSAVENKVSVADWHATILHLLGLHHHELFFARNGLEEKLIGVTEPRVLKELLA